MLQTGDVIGGRYRVERMLGMGGFGVVAAATHLELRSEVAIKMIRPEFIDDTETVERFLREARAVAQLRTEHVCRVFDIGRDDRGVPYIVMELLQGSDVASLIRSQPLPVHTAVDYARQACEALAEAHGRNIVHRDLKPPNLFVTRMPNNTSLLKVLDFGIAKAQDELRLTHTKITLGSPQYMSPEQLTTPKDVDARTDIWSLGVTLYHMLARRLPFPSAQMAELGVMILTAPPAPIDVDPGLRAILWRCLEKSRDARFQDIRELSAALAPYAQRAPVAASPPPQMPGAGASPIVPPMSPSSPPASQPQMPAMSTQASMPMPHVSNPMLQPHASMPMPHVSNPMLQPHASMPIPQQHASPHHAPNPHVSMPQQPAPTPARRSRALLFGALAVVLVGGGAIAGYVALATKDPGRGTAAATAPADEARAPDAAMAVAPDAAPVRDTVVVAPGADAAVATLAADAAVTADAARVATSPGDARKAAPPPPDEPVSSNRSVELELAKLEGRISATLRTAPELPGLMLSATQLACVLRDARKARRYYVDIGDAGMRKLAVDACRAYKIEL